MPLTTFTKELKKKSFAPWKGQKANGWIGVDLKPAFQKTSDSGEDVQQIGLSSREDRQKLGKFNRSSDGGSKS